MAKVGQLGIHLKPPEEAALYLLLGNGGTNEQKSYNLAQSRSDDLGWFSLDSPPAGPYRDKQ